MSTVARALVRAARQLQAVSPTARLDAELLMSSMLGVSRENMLMCLTDAPEPPEFHPLLERRLAGEPIAYIVGRRGFWTIELEVGPGVLIPRPDSETVLAAAVEHFRSSAGPRRILDLGTGPGTLLLAALDEWREATGIGVDRSPIALSHARRNAQRLGMERRAEWRLGDWGEGLTERFDLVLANPPYVALGARLGDGVAEYEPAEALFAGPDGLDAYRRLAPQIGPLIASGGVAVVEIGYDQAEAVGALLSQAGLEARLRHDLAGRPRAFLISAHKLLGNP